MKKILCRNTIVTLFLLFAALFLFTACATENPADAGNEQTQNDAAETPPLQDAAAQPTVADLQNQAAPAVADANEEAETTSANTATDAPKPAAKTTSKTAAKDTAEDKLSCTLSIVCGTILDHIDDFDTSKEDFLPEDGVIYAAKKVEFEKGETVFDVLLRETKANKIHMEFSKTPIYKSNYIEGLNNLYEFDCGPLSGWMYSVNGTYPNYGCSGYKLKDGDTVQWIYTCELGKDIGAPEWKEVAPPSE